MTQSIKRLIKSSTSSTSSTSSESDVKGGGCRHEASDIFDATAASSLSAATTSTSIKEPKGVREPSVFPAAGAPASTGESLNQTGQITSDDMVTQPGQTKADDNATGVDGRVVGSEGAPGASAEGGMCGQVAAEHSEEMKDGGEAEGLSEENAEVAVGGGSSTGPEAELSRSVAELEVEDDGESTVGLNKKRVTDSTARRQAGTRSSRSDGASTRQEAWHNLRFKQYRLNQSQYRNMRMFTKVHTCWRPSLSSSVSVSYRPNYLQCLSLELNKACRRVSTFIVTVGESCMPLDRLARNEVRVRPATAGNTMTAPGVMPTARVSRIRPCSLWRCLALDVLGQSEVDFACVRYLGTVPPIDYSEPPLDGVELPASLEHLEIGEMRMPAIARVKWPATLKHLQIGSVFSWIPVGIAEFSWPSSLQRVQLFQLFLQQPPYRGCVAALGAFVIGILQVDG
ncbi:unnamed protein product [Ectocarpus sp. CCAP 1310/34]|nr:unnamed protein product [Ectocarpus sp. CCAP 1310/34]